MDRHFTVSVYIVHEDKVLLHLHNRAKKILPIGGHIDFVYYTTAKSFDTKPEAGESSLLKWYNKEDLKNAYDIQQNVLTMANEVLELLGEG
ncbi:hypothetical protein [Clostridium omnivorum]|uniref:DUF4160 domain-containing protein n=1 Tax=Clostridium omnivorum TaxID=1604902 RepID=A0ABQ5N9F2_9CLOT|nr:hypothetical protein [Clostridium sp. E14]GLC31734.1 hypothetical protein bsdE14_31440 [Clostridium sp. E14]